MRTAAAKCLDEYKAKRVAVDTCPEGEEAPVIDGRLGAVVERMFQRCFADGEFTQAIGIALESRRLDIVRFSLPLPCVHV